MKHVTVTVGSTRIALPTETDIAVMKRHALEMVAAGGGFLEIGNPATRQTSILLSPGVPVVIEVEERDEVDSRGQAQHSHDDLYDLLF